MRIYYRKSNPFNTGFIGNIHKTVLSAKREKFMESTLINAKSLCKELEISFEPPRPIGRKHVFGDGSKEVQLPYEDDFRRAMLSSIDRVTAEI
ncbi:uncharacterized protein TNCV_325071 [Trichonephila clavipes]|nr:uncharacterized protein TNCV_325071 [Trichonephila clavipes]